MLPHHHVEWCVAFARVVYSRRGPYGPQCVSYIRVSGITADLCLWDVAYM